MAQKLQTGTSKATRYAIWAILILTVLSTIALYASMFLSQDNNYKEAKVQQDNYKKYQEATEEYNKKADKQAKELSAKYYNSFKEFEKTPSAFKASDVKELEKKDLKVGDGEEITDKTTEFYAYYIGWKPDGSVFDGSFNKDGLKLPLAVKKNNRGWGVIDGWSEGIQGMKVGGIREITIPADKAYGSNGSPNQQDPAKSIAPNTPLKFIIMLIPKFEEIPQPNYKDYGF